MHNSSVSSSGRRYPLRETVLEAWKHLGLKEIPDGNNGAPQGVAELVENRRDGLRQLTSNVYPLKGAHVMTETTVSRIILSDNDRYSKVATGVELSDGRHININPGGEVLVCGGAHRSPQILMLSGIGDNSELQKHGIRQ